MLSFGSNDYLGLASHPAITDALLTGAPDLDEDLVTASADYLSTRYADDPAAWGRQEPEVWERFADFLDDKRYSRNQIQFINLIIDELTDRGAVEARRVYESPYDGIAPEGAEAIFVPADLDRVFDLLESLAATASP